MMKIKQVIQGTLVCLLVLLLSGITFLAAPAMADSNSATVKTQKSSYTPNQGIEVEFSGFPGNNSDWITIVPANAADNTYKEWYYTQGKTSGTHTFKGLPAGDYEVRGYFNWSAGGYNVQTRSRLSIREGCQDASFVLNPVNNHCYGLTEVLTWSEAQAGAKAAGGNLATINDEAEQTWLLDTFKAQVGGGDAPSFWIGYTDAESPGTYKWVNDEPVTFTNWNKLWGEPNNYQNLNEHYVDFCAEVGFLCPEVGVWNDRPDGWPKLKGIIERS
ncbi:MAG: lectin-like protein [Actinomycetota bacterium]